ncbi:hypothetical protein [Luteimonas mephitis]|uniref:hypothetical protein n=1 Tax=Luteimonas mephitis TaxID=83615 RepID=UPI003A906680
MHLDCSAATSKAVSGKITGIYDYRVRACNAECGGWSAIATVAVELPPDAVPTISNIEVGFTSRQPAAARRPDP